MALNIKNAEGERLAGEVAHLARETKTGGQKRSKVWPKIPKEVLGKRISKRQREKILGYGSHGTPARISGRPTS